MTIRYHTEGDHACNWVYLPEGQRGWIAYDTCLTCGKVRPHSEGTPDYTFADWDADLDLDTCPWCLATMRLEAPFSLRLTHDRTCPYAMHAELDLNPDLLT